MQSNSLYCKLAVQEIFQIKSQFCWKHTHRLQRKFFYSELIPRLSLRCHRL